MTSPRDREPSSWLPAPPWEGLPPLFGLPWERQEQEDPRAPGRVEPTPRPPRSAPAPVIRAASSITRPGCTAADAALLNLSYLQGLSRGLGHFGVLQVGRERLEEGAKAAQQLGHHDLAREMRVIAQELPQVRDEAGAAALAEKLRPVVDRAWNLGASCNGSMTPQQVGRVRVLARQVREGRLSMDQAIKQVKEEQ